MPIVVVFLGSVLLLAGGGALIASVDLLPTELGMLYAVCGAVATCSAFIVFSIAAMIVRMQALAGLIAAPARPLLREEPTIDAAPEPQVSFEEPVRAQEPEEEAPVNENQAGRLPTLHEVEEAAAHPQAPPTLVGRYSAGGASYMIFSDGTIEAETEQGAFRFASMGEFKAFIAGRQA